MNDPLDSEREPLEQIADSFLARYRLGERPSIEEYVDRHPDLAEEIRAVFPTLCVMEELGPRDALPPAPPASELDRLGEYRILREIGRGGMGVVYEAEQEPLGRRVALKVLSGRALVDATHVERFRQEARAAARLHHTNIVPVFAVGEDRGLHYYAMQFIRGQSLSDVILEIRRMREEPRAGPKPAERPDVPRGTARTVADGMVTGRYGVVQTVTVTVPSAAHLRAHVAEAAGVRGGGPGAARPERAMGEGTSLLEKADASSAGDLTYYRSVARIGLQVAEALAYAHGEGVLHRDIKPSNLLLDDRGNAWVTDFGLAKMGDSSDLTLTGNVVGTLRYLAPERLDGHSDIASDVYSLGVTLYEMLTLRPPFDDDDRAELLRKIVTKDPMPPRRMDRGIPKDLETIVLKAISKEPRSRYAGAQALAADLRRFLDYQPVSARRASLPERFLRWHRRNPAVATLLCAVGILLVTLAAGAAFFALKLAREKDTAMKILERAVEAEREVRVRLGTAKLEEGRALRYSDQSGTRRRGLQALGEAAEIAPGLEVRNEVIGVLAQMDLEPLERVSVPGSELFLDSGHELGAVPDSDGSIRLYHADNFEEPIGTLPSTGSKVLAVELSPSAAYAAAKYDRADVPVSIFDVTREKEILRFPNPRGPFALSFHPCEERLCLGGNDGSIVEVALPGGDTIARFELGPGPRAIRYSPDGKRIAWIGAPGSTRAIQIIDMARHSVVARPFHRDAVLDADWSPDGKILATACSDYRAYLWDAGTFERIGTLEGHTAEVIRVAFSHDGLYLASASWDGRTILWQPDGGRELASAYGTFTRFRRRDGALGYRIADHKVGVWRIAGGEEYRALHAPVVEDKGPHECDVSSDGRWVAAACGAGGARVWSAERPRVSCAIRADFVVDVRFLADTSALLTSGSAGILRWPIRRDILPGEWILGPPRPLGIRGERFSVDDRARLVAVGQGHHAVVYHLEESRSMVARFGHPNLSRLQLSSSGRWLVTVTWHGSGVRVWDIEGAKLRKEFPCASARASFSPDERWLVIGTGASYSILDTLTWQERWSLSREGAGDLPGPIGFSGDSRLVALAHSRTHIDLHALATGQEIARLEPPRNLHGVTTAVLSRDGSCAAIGSEGETLHLWNLRLIRAHLANLGLDWEPRLGPPLAASRPDGVRLEHGPDRRWRNQASAERSERDDVIIEAFTALIAANPSPEAYRARAEALERRGLLHDALEDVEAAIALGPGDPSFEEWRGRLREECHGRRVERAEAEGMLSGDQPPRR